MEYGVILLLLKKRLKPKYSISFGLKKMFPNGDASSAQPPQLTPASQQQVKRRRTPGSPAGNATTMLGVGEIEEQKQEKKKSGRDLLFYINNKVTTMSRQRNERKNIVLRNKNRPLFLSSLSLTLLSLQIPLPPLFLCPSFRLSDSVPLHADY